MPHPPLAPVLGEMLGFMRAAGMDSCWGLEILPNGGEPKVEPKSMDRPLSRDERAKAWALGLPPNDYKPREVREAFTRAASAEIDADAQRGLDFVSLNE